MDENICARLCGAPREVDRRTFLNESVLAAAALALAACAASDITGAPTSVNGSISLASLPALANVNGIATVTVNGARLAIVRTGASSFLALSRVCPHQGATIGASGSGFHCPEHGATFNLNGTWVSGQRTSNMRSYPVTYDATAGTLIVG